MSHSYIRGQITDKAGPATWTSALRATSEPLGAPVPEEGTSAVSPVDVRTHWGPTPPPPGTPPERAGHGVRCRRRERAGNAGSTTALLLGTWPLACLSLSSEPGNSRPASSCQSTLISVLPGLADTYSFSDVPKILNKYSPHHKSLEHTCFLYLVCM